MKNKQLGSLQRGAQAGFTLIELIVVIVILGILAATALPKFTDLGADARFAKLKAAQGSVAGAVSMYHGRWLARGSPSTANVNIDTGVDVNTTGWVVGSSIQVAAGLADYVVTGTAPVTIKTDAEHTGCAFTYDPSNGTVTLTATVANC